MADQYVTAGSYQTVRVQSQTSVVDVELIGIYTKPSNIYIGVPVPSAAFKSGNYKSFLSVTAGLVESLLVASPDAGQTLASSVSYVQDIDASGLLSAFLDFTVSYTPTTTYQGSFSEIVRLPVTVFETADAFDTPINGKTPIEILDAAYARQKALANA
jgi:hypothetical protein